MLLGARQFFERRGAPPPPLPYDAEVEYLESDGDQYISGFYTYDGTETSVAMSIEWMKIASVPSGQNFIVGVASDTITNVSGPRFAQYQNGTRFSCDSGGWLNLGLLADSNMKYKTDVLFQSPDTISASMNGGTTSSGNRNFYVVQGTYILLFRITSSNKLIGRIYSAKFIIDGTLVRDMIPVRFTNELGQSEGAMYDRVTKKLFRNQGTGNFIVGRDTNPISARSYVNDGLVAMWDGIENAGWGMSDSGLRCEELTGNNDAILFNGDVIRIDNGFNINSHGLTSGYGYGIGNPLRSGDVSGVSTIQICFEYPAKYNNWQGVFRYNVSDIGINGGFNYLYHKNGNTRSASNCGNTFDTGEKTTVTMIFTVGEATPTVYVGGTQLSNVVSNGNYNGNNYAEVLIGAGYDSSLKPCKMIFRSARVYNRALTAAEIAANYAIDKARFNLP